MLTTILIDRFETDLNKLKEEITAYTDEAPLWKTPEGISNSGGNLALHLIGNLNHFIGAMLGNTGYVRQRDKEFSDKNVPKADLLKNIEDTRKMVNTVLTSLTPADMERTYPQPFAGKELATYALILQLYTHLNYHLGQINYHRRLVR